VSTAPKNDTVPGEMPAYVAAEWRATLDGMRDIVCLLNRDGSIRRCNEAMRRFLRKSFAAIIGKNCWQLVYGSPHAPHGCAITALRRKKGGKPVQCFLHNRWYNVSTDIIHDRRGRVAGGVHSLVDITDLKQAETRLYEYGRRLDMLHRIDHAILEVRRPAQVATDALRRLAQLVPGLSAGVMLFERETAQAELLAVSDGNRDRVGTRLPLTDRWVHALHKGDARPVPGLDVLLSAAQRQARAAGTRFVSLAIPLKAHGELIGSLDVAARSRELLQSGRIDAAHEVARSLAVSLHNACLFRTVNEQRKQIRIYATRLSNTEERERRDLARELHDRVGQNLTAVSINLNNARNQVQLSGRVHLLNRLDDAIAQINEISTCIRDVMCELRPPVLDDYGLVATLRWYGEHFAERWAIAVDITERRPFPRLSSDREAALFRIAQEALLNVARHARATTVRIVADLRPSAAVVTIADNGVGFDASAAGPPRKRSGWGLITMRERAEGAGATLRIDSRPGEGTRVMIRVPQRPFVACGASGAQR